uniref:polyribonucleotide nucleotidyltransferase n=1 Tax=Hirondellea gigas TaxID=1518452 RepID=A0A2P2I4N6_9CRUS
MHHQYKLLNNLCQYRSLLMKSYLKKSIVRSYSKDIVEVTAIFSNGHKLSLSSGCHAQLADGAVLATMGGTKVLVATVSKHSDTSSRAKDFLPLTVEYKQKSAAAGRVPNNHLRREIGMSDFEILTTRMIDRSIRPLFPEGFKDDTNVIGSLQAVDGVHSPDVIAINAASAALAVSPIPWGGPVGAVRMGFCDGEVMVNPTRKEMKHSEIDLVVTAGPKRMTVMLEGGCNNVLLQHLLKTIKAGVSECQAVVRAIEELANKAGKPKRTFVKHQIPDEIFGAVDTLCKVAITEVLSDYSHDKQSRDLAISDIRNNMMTKLSQDFPGQVFDLNAAFNQLFKSTFRRLILDTQIRCDGRNYTHVREISCQADIYDTVHGSSMFRRGQTQVQCTVAFKGLHADSPINPLLNATGGAKEQNFLLHYNFPQFSTNELIRPGGGGFTRREIGHGALAERALRPLLPKDLPLTVLLSANVLMSNGSSSMGTVCGGSMALFDAGVKLSAPAAGVAIGLITDTDDEGNITNHCLLTDILGIEDYLGDMDFKIAGTRKGITALQADIKLKGLPLSIVMDALMAATAPRAQIISEMNEAISRPRESKDTWPVVSTFTVPPSRRSKVNGFTLKNLQANHDIEIWWEDGNQLKLFAANPQVHEEVREVLDTLLQDKEPTLEFGAIYSATITELRPNGVMVQLYDDMTPALLHISQLDIKKVQHPSALGLQVGQSIKVKHFGRDPSSGQLRLSRRAIQAASQIPKNLHSTETATPTPASAATHNSSAVTAAAAVSAVAASAVTETVVTASNTVEAE